VAPLTAYMATFRPSQGAPRRLDFLRAGGGAFVGILVTALVGQAFGWGPAELP
jgi:CBS-domain-containing membrane protein